MFKYDTIMGNYHGSVKEKNGKLIIDGYEISLIAELDPEKIDWDHFEVDWVVEACGKFTDRERASMHIGSGAQSVLITAPAQDEDITIVPGVNDEKFDKTKHKIVSLGSCTTNALLPMLKILHESFGITHGFMTTIHAYTNSQVLLDVEKGKDLRRCRAAALNIIPTTTGATKVLGKVMPELDGLIGGAALRVPVAKVSLVDLVFSAKKDLSVQKIRDAFTKASQGKLSTIIGVTNEQLVSSDFCGNPHSVIIDLPTIDVCGPVGKLFGWYDNEWAYSVRLKDFLVHAA